MHTEVPVCKRCCFCLPLRYGLIAWGYFRLASSMLFFVGMSFSIWGLLQTREKFQANIVYIVIIGVLLLLTTTDLVLNTVFIVGAHKKNLRLLRTYYIYSFILCILMSLMAIASAIQIFLMFKIGELDLAFHIWIVVVDTATLLAQVLAQIYALLLVRSEIMKLRSNCEFKFVNNAAEAQCTMKYAEEMQYGEEGTKCRNL